MEKKYIFIVLILFWGLPIWSQTTQSNFINYQGVARDAEGQLLVNTQLDVQLALRFGANSATPSYEEIHTLTTDANGVFSLKIGNGIVLNGNYDALPWGSQSSFICTSIDGVLVGTTEINAVPFAISSGDAQQNAAQVPFNGSVSGLGATNVQDAINTLANSGGTGTDDQNLELSGDVLSIEGGTGSVDLSTYIDDADADITNELQTLSFDVGTNELSLSNGNTITIPSGGTDADADPTNEIQDIALAGTELSITSGSTIDLAPLIPPGGTDDQNLELTGDVLSIEGGAGSVDLSTYIDDADADATNELQNLSFDVGTNELSLSNGNTVTILSGGTDADADPTNELQDISLDGPILSITEGSSLDLEPLLGASGTDNQNLVLTGDVLSIEGGTGSVDLSTYIDDADSDATNELQTLSFDVGTNELSLSNGNTVTIPSGAGTSPWQQNGSGDIFYNSGNVGIGLTNPNAPQHVHQDAASSNALYTTTDSGDGTNDGLFVGLVNRIDGLTGEIINQENGPLFLGANGLNTLRIMADGRVGVGGIFPNEALEVSGTIRSSDLAGAGQRNVVADAQGNLVIGAGGGGDATELNDLSDARTDTGNESLFIGNSAGERSNGAANTAVGDLALFNNILGSHNTAFGATALANTQGTSHNTGIGARALSQNRASDNTAIGSEALTFSTNGSGNTAVGRSALLSNSIGAANTAIGRSALSENTVGNLNTAVGQFALNENITGDSNTAIGQSALSEKTNGDGNTALGHNAMRSLTSGNNNLALGQNTQVPNSTGSNQVRVGNTNIILAQIQVAWTVTSDRRWKTDIQDLPYGLNMVNQLRPVDYRRKNNENQTRETGFIAQEVEAVLKQLGYEDQGILTKDDQGYRSLRYNDFVPILTKAIQEQQEQLQQLTNMNKNMQAQLNALQNQVVELQQITKELKETNTRKINNQTK